MDIQTRKLNFVQEFLRLKNEELIQKFEKILLEERKKQYEENLKPYTIEEYNNLIDEAKSDAEYGRIKETGELKKDIDSWE